MAIRTRNGIIGGKPAHEEIPQNKEPIDIFKIEEVVKQMRYLKGLRDNKGSDCNNWDALPKFASRLDAAIWIRANGNNPLTNETFKGLLSDLIGRTVSDEEYLTARIYTSPLVKYMKKCSVDGFITVEEKEHLEKIIKDKDTVMRIQIVDTILGSYVEGL